jgi:hypothetical protein
MGGVRAMEPSWMEQDGGRLCSRGARRIVEQFAGTEMEGEMPGRRLPGDALHCRRRSFATMQSAAADGTGQVFHVVHYAKHFDG